MFLKWFFIFEYKVDDEMKSLLWERDIRETDTERKQINKKSLKLNIFMGMRNSFRLQWTMCSLVECI